MAEANGAAQPLLRVEGLACGYGEALVLSGISFELQAGRSLALLGRNGAGKTTLIDTLVGVARLSASRATGRIALAGRSIERLAPHQRAAPADGSGGIGWVPQQRNIFRSLTVHENLSAVVRPGPWDAERAYRMFPRLAERRGHLGNQLSGGEQQMLAIARALVLNPRLLLLDEPLEGLAPIIVEELLAALHRIVRDEGLSAIVVEQHPALVLGITDEAIVLERGGIALRDSSAALRSAPQRLERFLSAAAVG
ncbi:MAG: ATP-binding cassette domain-containing protein [Burkholderiaceae bacterium]|nr:ATP-binding cassette domain-containing protein [Burkholderiaceae bacterium]